METEQKLRVLAKIASKLNAAGIEWDVGASLLLYLHGIADEFHDIDLMVKQEDADSAAEILDQLGTRSAPKTPDPKYHTKRF
ncbi:MAG: nucleotidyltransferase domain-containing protein, partial [Bulleidia sp.]